VIAVANRDGSSGTSSLARMQGLPGTLDPELPTVTKQLGVGSCSPGETLRGGLMSPGADLTSRGAGRGTRSSF